MDRSPAWKATAKLIRIDRGNVDMQYEMGKSWLSLYGEFPASTSLHGDTECVLVFSWTRGTGSWGEACGWRDATQGSYDVFTVQILTLLCQKETNTEEKDIFLTTRPKQRRLSIPRASSRPGIVQKKLETATYSTAEQTLMVLEPFSITLNNITSDAICSAALLGLHFIHRRNRKRPLLSPLHR